MTTTNIATQNFCFNDNTVRVLADDPENPWFVAKDVCDVLDLKDFKTSLRALDDDEKGVHTVPTPGGNQRMTVVNESGLYELIFRSRKPEAREFKRWVKQEVLPSIRKHGGYLYGQEDEDDPAVLMAKGLKAAQSIIESKEQQLEQQREMLEEDLSVDSYRGFYLQEYLSQSEKIRIGQAATRLRKVNNLPANRQSRLVRNKYGDLKETMVNLYPKWVLDLAVDEVLV